jgi:uncharacterized protein (TIGR03083 family)
MTADATPWIDALHLSHDHLADKIAELTPDQLRAQSMCTDWDVSQVLSHLGSGAEITRNGLDAAVNGTEPPPNEAIWDRWNAMSPDERATAFVDSDARHLEMLDSLDDATRESLQIDLGFLPAPIDLTTAVGMRLNEHALHSWDVFATFDPEAGVDRSSAALLASRVSPVFRFMANGEWAGEPGTIALHLTDPEIALSLGVGDETTLTTGSATDPVARLDLPAEAWLRLIYGRLAPERTPSDVRAEPDDLVDQLRGLFKGF